jgi:hypothetical protein
MDISIITDTVRRIACWSMSQTLSTLFWFGIVIIYHTVFGTRPEFLENQVHSAITTLQIVTLQTKQPLQIRLNTMTLPRAKIGDE